MISIIDYGMGNLRSVEKAFQKLGYEAKITNQSKEISTSSKIVFPGVGAIRDCIKNLKDYQLYETVIAQALSGKPFLGICLGLQAMFHYSEEGEGHEGLGIIEGGVVKFKSDLKVPHMGWNEVEFEERGKSCPLLKDIPNRSYAYFVHSYYGVPMDQSWIAAKTEYGTKFVSVLWKENLFATQFHPEKSQEIGLKILKNFAEL